MSITSLMPFSNSMRVRIAPGAYPRGASSGSLSVINAVLLS